MESQRTYYTHDGQKDQPQYRVQLSISYNITFPINPYNNFVLHEYKHKRSTF